MNELDPAGLEAAAKAMHADGRGLPGFAIRAGIRAYLAAAPVPPDGEPDAPIPDWEFAGREEDRIRGAQEHAYARGFAAGRAAATPDPPDGDKRVRVTCFDPVTGESETQPLDPDNYILTLGERCEITACQVYANGTVQLTIKRGADQEAPDEET